MKNGVFLLTGLSFLIQEDVVISFDFHLRRNPEIIHSDKSTWYPPVLPDLVIKWTTGIPTSRYLIPLLVH